MPTDENNITGEVTEKNDKGLEYYKNLCEEQMLSYAELERDYISVKSELEGMKKTISWRFTAPFRALARLLQKVPPIRLFCKVIVKIKRFGIKYTFNKIKTTIRMNRKMKSRVPYTEEAFEEQRNFVFKRHILLSIIVPLYNTPREYLCEMIESVKAQTYSNWELCLADGSDAEHDYVGEICTEYANADTRIKYKKLEKNLGISGNTNAAIEMTEGEYIALFDHDDKLHPAALYEMVKAVNEKEADFIYTDEAKFTKNEKSDAYDFFCKPDFSPDMLRSCNYICHFTSFSRELYQKVGGFRSEFDGSQDHDMILRLTEKAEKIIHIPEILYYWRCHAASVASDVTAKPYTTEAAKAALSEHLSRVGLSGEIMSSMLPSTYRIKYKINGEPLVSLMIPNKDHTEELKLCLDSVYGLSAYKNFEVVIIENNSTEEKTFEFYEYAKQHYSNLRVVTWKHEFNYSKINNFGFEHILGEYVILLNNDIEIITPEWIEEMLMFTQRDDVGAAGMMLYYPDNTVQHGGVILGHGGVAGHSHKHYPRGVPGYFGRLSFAQNYSAVTAAAMMVKASVYREVGGLDPLFAVAFNDIDFCVRIGKAGYRIVWTPYAEAYHYESKSRGQEDSPEKIKRFEGEIQSFLNRWCDLLAEGDPYYNPNLTLEKDDFSPK